MTSLNQQEESGLHAWHPVARDGMPPCDGETVFVGINSAGFVCCFNDARPDGLCLMGSPECSTAQMSELRWWRVLDRPGNESASALHLARSRIRELEEALERISRAKPDRLDHALDVAIIERAASVARSVLNKEQKA